MIPLHTPLLMVGAFLILNLVVGLAGKPATTFREYAVGNQRFSTVMLVATLVATCNSSKFLIGGIHRAYTNDLYELTILMSLGSVALWIISRIWVYMVPFMQHFSIAETIGSVYGKYPRIITALYSTIQAVGTVAIEIKTISSIISICMDIDSRTLTVLVALVVITYTTFGGIRAVTNTDMLQFIIYSAIILLIAKLMFVKTGKSVLEIVSFLHKQEKCTPNSLLLHPLTTFNLVANLLWSLLPTSDPAIVQRIYLCASPIQVKKTFLYSSFLLWITVFFICLIGLFVFTRDPTLPATAIWEYIIADMPPFLKGCMVISVLGMCLSTADSYLHTAAIIVGHDLLKSIRGIKPVSDKLQIQVAKLALLMIGLLAMVVAIYYNDAYNAMVSITYITHTIGVCIVKVPFILAVFGFRGTFRTVLIGTATATLSILVCKKLELEYRHAGYLVPALANGLGMMAAHYLLPQPRGTGWMPLNNQQKRIQQLSRTFKRHKKILHSE